MRIIVLALLTLAASLPCGLVEAWPRGGGGCANGQCGSSVTVQEVLPPLPVPSPSKIVLGESPPKRVAMCPGGKCASTEIILKPAKVSDAPAPATGRWVAAGLFGRRLIWIQE